ncbi:hypothetical protein BRD56_13045 [Thermoplasmatales archaeon SW_10_69_26]|nr:MAG: hypothetical protein BRD56_13045 [Thermoplasmatales archaeon SW_10_69_26]
MLERAEQLMEQGAVDDGDAELLVEEDDEPEADPERSQRAHSQRSEQTDPGGAGEPQPAEQSQQPRQSHQPQQADPAAEPTQPRGAEKDPMPAEDGSDAEILDPEPSTSRPEPDAEPPEPEPASTARGSPSESTPDPETTDPSTSSPPDAVDSPAAAAGARSEDPSFVSGTTIEPQVDRDEALREAEEALFEADDARLELLPFRVYRYQARLVGDGAEREDEGRVWVSTQSGAVVRAPAGDRVAELDQPHERFDGSMSGDETQAAAREHLLDSLERRDERRQDYNESAVIERVQLEPDPEALAVDRLGKAYAPRWRVEGPDGTVFVDAVTGEVVTD